MGGIGTSFNLGLTICNSSNFSTSIFSSCSTSCSMSCTVN
jgi:hypothetical protein